MGEARQRIDKWLWFARVVKSRTLAAKLVSSGAVRVNRQPVDQPSFSLRLGDVLTFAVGTQVRVWRVVELGARRGPAPEARLLYEDVINPPSAPVHAQSEGMG